MDSLASTPPSTASASVNGIDVRALYRAHFTFVWRLLRRLGTPPSSLDDAVQDVFLIIHRRSDELEWRSSERALLAGVVIKVAKDYRRRLQRQSSAASWTEATQEPADAPNPEQAATRAQAMQFAQSLIDALSDEQRTVLVMADVEGLSGPEMAEVLNVSVNTVYSRLRLAREAFNRMLVSRGEMR